MFAKVLLFQRTGFTDDALTYAIPTALQQVEVGALVEVPLRNQKVAGVVMAISEEETVVAKGKVKEIGKIIYANILLGWQIEMLNWLSNEYLTPKWSIVRHMIPEQIREEKIALVEKPIKKQKGGERKYILAQDRETILLSMKALLQKHAGGQTIIVTPEINIPPFWITELKKEFSTINLADMKTPKKKAMAWKDIFEGEYEVIIGSRSALYAPARNIKNIIIINEHSIGHKEDQRPKFHTRELANFMGDHAKANITHISTSISMAMWHQGVEQKTITIPTPQRRIDISVKMIDMRDERKKQNYSPISEELLEVLNLTLERKSQAILFLNRKGRANCLLCKDCGFIPKCDVCERNLVVKVMRDNREFLQCISGEKVFEVPIGCTRCGSMEFKMVGAGQEKIESLLQKEFPSARIMRYASDNFATPKEQANILKAFSDKKIDILITSQLLYSLAPIPQVPVVCALNIDTSLTIPQFQSAEKTLHQLQEMQALLKPKGLLMIQSYIPDTPLLQAYNNNRLQPWYDEELETRKIFNYPPWSRIIFLTSYKKDRVEETLNQTMDYLGKTRPHLKIQHAAKMFGHIIKHYLVIRGLKSEDDLDAIKKMPDIILDFDSPYLT